MSVTVTAALLPGDPGRDAVYGRPAVRALLRVGAARHRVQERRKERALPDCESLEFLAPTNDMNLEFWIQLSERFQTFFIQAKDHRSCSVICQNSIDC